MAGLSYRFGHRLSTNRRFIVHILGPISSAGNIMCDCLLVRLALA